MKLIIDIEGKELDELTAIVIGINQEFPHTPITIEQWCTNLIANTMRQRMRDQYIHAAATMDLTDLSQKFGPVADLRNARKGIL